jgi:hypothetical protein
VFVWGKSEDEQVDGGVTVVLEGRREGKLGGIGELVVLSLGR